MWRSKSAVYLISFLNAEIFQKKKKKTFNAAVALQRALNKCEEKAIHSITSTEWSSRVMIF